MSTVQEYINLKYKIKVFNFRFTGNKTKNVIKICCLRHDKFIWTGYYPLPMPNNLQFNMDKYNVLKISSNEKPIVIINPDNPDGTLKADTSLNDDIVNNKYEKVTFIYLDSTNSDVSLN